MAGERQLYVEDSVTAMLPQITEQSRLDTSGPQGTPDPQPSSEMQLTPEAQWVPGMQWTADLQWTPDPQWALDMQSVPMAHNTDGFLESEPFASLPLAHEIGSTMTPLHYQQPIYNAPESQVVPNTQWTTGWQSAPSTPFTPEMQHVNDHVVNEEPASSLRFISNPENDLSNVWPPLHEQRNLDYANNQYIDPQLEADTWAELSAGATSDLQQLGLMPVSQAEQHVVAGTYISPYAAVTPYYQPVDTTAPNYFGMMSDTDRNAAAMDYSDPFPSSFAPETANVNTLNLETDDGSLLNSLQEYDRMTPIIPNRFNGNNPNAMIPTNVPDHLYSADTIKMILDSVPLPGPPPRDDFAGLVNLRNSSQMHNSASIGPDGAELAHASPASGPSASSAQVSKKPTRKPFTRWEEEEFRVTLGLRTRHTKSNGQVDHASLYEDYLKHYPNGRNQIAVREKLRKYDKETRTKAALATKGTGKLDKAADTKDSLLENGTEKVGKAAGAKGSLSKNGTGKVGRAAGTKGPLPTRGTRKYRKAATSLAEGEADELSL